MKEALLEAQPRAGAQCGADGQRQGLAEHPGGLGLRQRPLHPTSGEQVLARRCNAIAQRSDAESVHGWLDEKRGLTALLSAVLQDRARAWVWEGWLDLTSDDMVAVAVARTRSAGTIWLCLSDLLMPGLMEGLRSLHISDCHSVSLQWTPLYEAVMRACMPECEVHPG